MAEPVFFTPAASFSVDELAGLTGARVHAAGAPGLRIANIAGLDRAGPLDIAFLDHGGDSAALATTCAGACLVPEAQAGRAPARTAVLVSAQPFGDFVTVARALFPSALRPSSLFGAAHPAPGASADVAPGALVHPSARLESGVRIDPGVVVGPRAEIGAGTSIAAGAVIGPEVRIGRHCAIGAGASLIHVFLGDRVVVQPGCRIGQDGIAVGYLAGAGDPRDKNRIKVPQVGRVIIQDDVEIGAGTAIERGWHRDTVIGEGTKIDNLVQIAHNVTVGRHCVIVAQAGIAGDATVEDFVVLGARASVAGHVTIGEGARVAATSVVQGNVPEGATV